MCQTWALYGQYDRIGAWEDDQVGRRLGTCLVVIRITLFRDNDDIGRASAR